jgi:predicted dehydrogenase
VSDTCQITRRDAVKAVAAAPLAVALQSAQAANSQVGFGVIGSGARGRDLIACFNRIGSGRCIAVSDSNDTNLRSGIQLSVHKPQSCKDYRELLGRKEIEAVVVATPPHTHFAIVRDALLAGKHVFCENVLVFKPEEVHALRALADTRSEQIVQVGLERRYSKFYQTAKQMVSKGFLGEITNIQAQWHRNRDWVMDPQKPKEANWPLLREFSGGLTSELASHQMDVADWMFNDTPEFVVGVGGLDWKRDGRDTYDNISLIFKYPGGQKFTYTAITSNKHLPMFRGERSGFGETIMGTEGTIEITLGTEQEPALGLWYFEPNPVKVSKAEDAKEIARVAGSSMASSGRGLRVIPILLERDQINGDEPFLEREMKYARRWLYAKGIMVPQEVRNPMEVQLESFLECCREGKRPKAHLEAGLNNSSAVILANMAMDQNRRVAFTEFERLGRGGKAGAKK